MSPPPSLTGAQKRYLRGLGHHLSPVVHVGKEGVSAGVLSATGQALDDHELIKVKLPQVGKAERKTMAGELGESSEAAVCGLTGRVVLLYRAHPDKPVIRLPR